MLVVGTEGKGVGPPPEGAEWVTSGGLESSMLASVRAGVARLRAPTAEVVAAVEAFEPVGGALVIGTFLNEAPELCGRPFLAWRRPEWLALEDKLVADDVWDRAGVARAPSAVVPLDPAAVSAAAHQLDRGAGTVWAADASEGWHGGAELVRWVRTRDEVDAVCRDLSGHSSAVRVMPFLPGVPCSIHGIVYPGYVSALRPVEQVSLRRPGRTRFFYAGCASFYDPPDAVRASMRTAARRVGDYLREAVGYRGAFTIDGVVGEDGFLPTELNPRSGAGLHTMLRALPDIPFQLLLDAARRRRRAGLRPCRPRSPGGRRGGRAPGRWHVAPGRDTATRAVVAAAHRRRRRLDLGL